MDMRDKPVVPFDAFTPVFKLLTWAGYYKLNNPTTRWQIILYAIYKRAILVILLVYVSQFFFYIIKPKNNKDDLVVSLIYLSPLQNSLVKSFNMFIQLPKIAHVNDFLKDGIFNSTLEEDQKILRKHIKDMHRLQIIIVNYIITINFTLWAINSVVKRFVNGEHDVVPMYFPYRTDTLFGFCMLILNQMSTVFWIGHGHMSIDVLFTTYYAHAHTQLKIIKRQLSALLEDVNNNEEDYLKDNFVYKDLTNAELKQKFVAVVQRYDKLVWYVNEVAAIFNFPTSLQFLSSGVSVCFVVYSVTKVSVMSLTFVFLFVFILLLLLQVFLYCYVGNFIYVESASVNDALYDSDWLSLSPSFRRLLLIAMVRWSRPLQPKVCGFINMSLSTFISIIRSSYTLYTVLITTESANNE